MSNENRVSIGVDGLDDVLEGGLLENRAYMIRGQPGTGKTLLGLQFLAAGTERGESSLCVNFEEPTAEIEQNTENLGVDISDVEFLDLTPDAEEFTHGDSYDVFAPDEVESDEVTDTIVDAVDEHAPDRVFVDPVTHLRHFSPDDYQFRKEVASFVNYLTENGATVVFSTQPTAADPDDDLQFICDGTIELGHSGKGRVAEVKKFRGSDFAAGEHTLRIREGGHEVYPTLVPRHDNDADSSTEQITAGVEELDALLHGGIERGAVTVISGPSGVGKTTTGTHFMKEAATWGERSVIYLFEETADTFRRRSNNLGIPVEEMEEDGTLAVEEIEPVEVSSDEFASMVREEVEEQDASIVMIDGVSGYRLSIRDEAEDDELVRELHSLCRYCKNQGVTVILTDDVPSVTGDFQVTSSRISYLGDNILFLRYLEIEGELQKAMGVLKKRASDFERGLRSFNITNYGLTIGEPMEDLRGILSGAPEFRGDGTDE